MNIIANIIGAVHSVIAVLYQNSYTDENNVFYCNENNEIYNY